MKIEFVCVYLTPARNGPRDVAVRVRDRLISQGAIVGTPSQAVWPKQSGVATGTGKGRERMGVLS